MKDTTEKAVAPQSPGLGKSGERGDRGDKRSHSDTDAQALAQPTAGHNSGHSAERNVHVEALRLIAIVGIAIFHTFLPFFNSVAYGTSLISGTDVSALSQSGVALFFLGFVSLLGSMGNNIFFMISGFYLIPSLQRDSALPGFWSRQLRKTVRRAVIVVATVAFYAVIAVCVDTWIVDIPGVSLHSWSWLVGGLEFVWLYLVAVFAAPVVAWLQGRFSRAWPIFVVSAFFIVMMLNCYIAFFSQGGVERGLTDWRKLMSAATYGVAFILAGFIGSRWSAFRSLGASLAWGSVVLTVAVVTCVAAMHDASLMGALSFKSTSLLAFLMALGGLIAASSSAPKSVSESASESTSNAPGVARLIRFFAAGILGFYVANALFDGLVSKTTQSVLLNLLGIDSSAANSTGVTLSVPGLVSFAGAGIGISVGFVAVVLLFDRLVAHPILSAVHLTK
ncbi:MAG: acyltransferase [Bifidobacteriaceae bacterium]|jgi:peptidoglycan/LPS O-acetylase OafA/YrhL|nr:acyltransferase [Bifidobacteriaceae bacterium]MCI1979189.1 acyltransferase [Bifidobacteriaceae bacterium]